MSDFKPHPDYEKLPDCIKACISSKAYAWMGDSERVKLIDDLCLPDPEED